MSLAGRTAVLVDDGVATGGTATAAAHAARARGATKVVLAVPVGPPDAAERFAAVVDEFVCLEAPEGFFAVGAYYAQFGQTSDDEVRRLLAGARHDTRDGAATATVDDPPPALGGLDWSQLRRQEVEIPADSTLLPGNLRLPPSARGLVIFAHGSGSSRLSPRNIEVASALNAGGLATLLFDLLTDAEASARENVFDVTLLAGRLVAATHWAARAPGTADCPSATSGRPRSGRRPLRCRRSGQRHPGGRFTWGPPGSGRITARRRDRSHPADRWRGRPGRAETQRGRGSLPAVPARARCGPGSDPPVRGARGA